MESTPTSASDLQQTRFSPVAGAMRSVDVCVSGRLPLPYRMPISLLRPSLLTSLTQGVVLAMGEQSELCETIYQDVTKHTL